MVFERGANCWNDGSYINVIMPEMCASLCCHMYMCLQRLGMYSVARSLTKLGGKNFSTVLIFQTWGPSGFCHFVSLPQSSKVNWTNSLSALSCRGLVNFCADSCCPNRTDVWCRRVIHGGTRCLDSCGVFVKFEIMWRTICFALMYVPKWPSCSRIHCDTFLSDFCAGFASSVLLMHSALWIHLFTSGLISSLACRKISVLRFLLTSAV